MSKANQNIIEVTNEVFKKIKRKKQTLLFCLNNDENKKINVGKKIIILSPELKKYMKRKVRRITTYTNISEIPDNNTLNKKLGYKIKDSIDYKKLVENIDDKDLKKYGLLGIEIRKKGQFKKYLLLSIIIFIAIFVAFKLFGNYKTYKFKNDLNKIAEERIDYVFIEINPKFVLSVKNNKTEDVACLNEDCLSIYKDINIKGKDINNSIDNLYNLVKDKGFDVTKGITVKTNGNIKIEEKNHIKFELIDSNTQYELLSKVLNNKNINDKNINESYYSKLWDKLKKDNDYGKVYSCKMNNNELECYINENFDVFNGFSETGNDDIDNKNIFLVIESLEKLDRVFKKFGFDTRDDMPMPMVIFPAGFLYINGNKFMLDLDVEPYAKDIYYHGRIGCYWYKVYLSEINLLKPNNINIIINEEEDGEIIFRGEDLKIIEYDYGDGKKEQITYKCHLDDGSISWEQVYE